MDSAGFEELIPSRKTMYVSLRNLSAGIVRFNAVRFEDVKTVFPSTVLPAALYDRYLTAFSGRTRRRMILLNCGDMLIVCSPPDRRPPGKSVQAKTVFSFPRF